MRKLFSILALALAFTGCDTEDPTTAVVDDGYPVLDDGGDVTKQVTVYKVWWVTSLFLDPVVPGAESAAQRTVPANDHAYALLAPGWDPASSTPPTNLVPVRSATTLTVKRGDTLHITVSDGTFVGNCAAGKSLSQDDADFITQSIFPGDFAAVTYDAKTCASTPLPSDGGADVGSADAPASEAGDAGNGG